MRVLGDLVARDRRSDEVALRVDARDRAYSYRDFCTTAWKAGHACRHLGVHAGSCVALAPDPAPQPLLTLFGAACLGARAIFDTTAEARAVLVPTGDVAAIGERPGRKVVVYGDAPTDPGITHWERVVWSENPAFPPTPVDPDGPVLLAGDDAGAGSRARALTHREVLGRAERVAEENGLDGETAVVVRDGLADPGVVVAGVFAPLLAGGTVVFPGPETVGDLAVVSAAGAGDATTEPVPESRVIDAASVLD